MKMRRAADGAMLGECQECGNAAHLHFRHGRWLCAFCHETARLLAGLDDEKRTNRTLVAVTLLPLAVLLLLALPMFR